MSSTFPSQVTDQDNNVARQSVTVIVLVGNPPTLRSRASRIVDPGRIIRVDQTGAARGTAIRRKRILTKKLAGEISYADLSVRFQARSS